MKKACIECPFKKSSAPGYLGEVSYQPEVFLQQINEAAIPCHLSINWENKDEKFKHSKDCVGALQFMNNSLKMSRDYDTAKLQKEYGKSDEIFSRTKEFIDHHKNLEAAKGFITEV
jgi:hypothetical protein